MESFSVRVAVFSISLRKYLSHADGVPITDPKTLKPSTIVKFVPSNFYGAVETVFFYHELTLIRLHIVFESLSLDIQVVQYCAETPKITCSASIICVPFWVTFGFRRSSISGIIPIPYIAIAKGSTCVVPFVDVKIVLLTY